MLNSIKLSIITVNLNNARGLEKTIQSVSEQTFTDKEFLVIDGMSNDDSLKVIQKYQFAFKYWISEPDTGIYNAMNKGIRIAKGNYCLFLNSGDWLSSPTILEEVFNTVPKADIVAGDVYFFDTYQKKIKWNVQSPEKLSAKTLISGTLPHQATFIKRDLFNVIGNYNEQLKIASDWLFWVEALLQHGCSYQHYKGVISYFNMDGISCDRITDSLPKREKYRILEKKYPLFLADYIQLEYLEKQSNQWLSSREFIIYTYFQKIGLIQLGVHCLRLYRYTKRMFINTSDV